MTSTDDVAEHAARDAERMVKMSAIRALAIAGYRISIEFSDGSVVSERVTVTDHTPEIQDAEA